MGNNKSKGATEHAHFNEEETQEQATEEDLSVKDKTNHKEEEEEKRTEGNEQESENEEEKKQPTQEESEDSSSDSEGENELPDTLSPNAEKQQSTEIQYAWEQKIVEDTLMKRSPIIKAAIVGLDGALKAWAPSDFTPDNQAIQDILDGFEGDVGGLAERGLVMGCGANPAVPAKMEDAAIFGNDGKGGGTSVFKTHKNIIIIVFKKNPTISHRLAMRTATFMRNYDR